MLNLIRTLASIVTIIATVIGLFFSVSEYLSRKKSDGILNELRGLRSEKDFTTISIGGAYNTIYLLNNIEASIASSPKKKYAAEIQQEVIEIKSLILDALPAIISNEGGRP